MGYQLGTILLLISSLSFLIAAASFHLSNRYAGAKNLNRITESAMIVIFISIIVAGACVFYLKTITLSYNLQEDQTLVVSAYPTMSGTNCNKLTTLLNTNQLNFMINSTNCPQ